jgi:hypothetical protein
MYFVHEIIRVARSATLKRDLKNSANSGVGETAKDVS